MPEEDTKIVKLVLELIKEINKGYGPFAALGMLLAVLALFAIIVLLRDWWKDRVWKELVGAKDAEIERLVEERNRLQKEFLKGTRITSAPKRKKGK